LFSQEWLVFTVNRMLSEKEQRIFAAFQQMDLDGDGHITADELRTGM
jgi:Ca2+-binding EF-hand superfamily protein